ncbi:hypothetical protein HL653_21485 [Sphingomonas sp. AP4-R1]|uniref:TorF family putative porin n=1 Tax=Sphingomonas sp. AP4-R1 TaxID=2735134 RepID=UPI0014933BA5|nr:TorF family putative porin [Sphingomonas sp. AP4-R1]QJU59976.1 hypothetical protein HL653_21485 [Sphingomonas sp. AP4-R1]
MNVCATGAARTGRSVVTFAVAVAAASSGIAGIGGQVTIASEQTFRGRSISAGRSAIGLDLAYDDGGGPYAGTQVEGVLDGDATPHFLSARGYAGFARRIGLDLTVDAGLTHTRFSHYSGFGRETDYSELFAGLANKRSSARISISPNWLGRGNVTAYGEITHLIPLSDRWNATLHGGLLLWLSDNLPQTAPRLRYDIRIGLSRRLGRAQLEAGWVVGGPRMDRYRGDEHGHHILTIAASLPF